MPGGKALRQLSMVARIAFAGRQRVRARPLEHRHRHRRIAVEIGVRRIILRRKLDRARRPCTRTTAVAVCLTTMLPNSSGSASRPSVCTAIWNAPGSSTGGWFEHARGDLDVLPLQRRRRRRSRSGSSDCSRSRIEPDPHRIIAAAEHGDRADAVDAGQRVLDLERSRSSR